MSKIGTWLIFLITFYVKFKVYIGVAAKANLHAWWSWTYEPQGSVCKYKPREDNTTGIKVLVYSTGKTGTTTMSRALVDVGLKTYHSEDFVHHVWSPLVDSFWLRPENGGKIWSWNRLSATDAPAQKGHSLKFEKERASDLYAFHSIQPEALARAVSKCRVDAMVFDGLEQFFWPLLNSTSPDVKVLVTDWRSYPEWKKSGTFFGPTQYWGLYALAYAVLGMHLFPWNAVALPILDPLFGRPIETYMREGLPSHAGIDTTWGFEPFLACVWRMQFTERRERHHRYSGLGYSPDGELEYRKFWDAIKVVPAERRLHWNMRKHGYKDLCSFLSISGNPFCGRSGSLPKSGINVLNHEREQSLANKIFVPLYLAFLHFLSWKMFFGILRLFLWKLPQYVSGIFRPPK